MPWTVGEAGAAGAGRYRYEDAPVVETPGRYEVEILDVEERTSSTGKPMLRIDLGVVSEDVRLRDHLVEGNYRVEALLGALGAWDGPGTIVDGEALATAHVGARIRVDLSRQEGGDYAGRLQVDRYLPLEVKPGEIRRSEPAAPAAQGGTDDCPF